ncbi:MAG: hypothetical protein J0M08_03665 [Bacteroidetes bacterium]|nr:hypothetical protein [Bacteroidota bacterium]
MKNTIIIYLLLLLVGFSQFIQSQTNQNTITVVGKVVDYKSKVPPERIMVVNKRTYTGMIVGADGKFTTTIPKTDTLIITALGYELKNICFKDSISKTNYQILISLYPKTYYGNEVVIRPIKPIKEVEKEIGSISSTYKPSYSNIGRDNVITALYMRFSKFEQSKQRVAELEERDAMQDALKELLRIYIKNDIMYLDDKEFDDFIEFCGLNINYVQSSTMYELAEYIKQRYDIYKTLIFRRKKIK